MPYPQADNLGAIKGIHTASNLANTMIPGNNPDTYCVTAYWAPRGDTTKRDFSANPMPYGGALELKVLGLLKGGRIRQHWFRVDCVWITQGHLRGRVSMRERRDLHEVVQAQLIKILGAVYLRPFGLDLYDLGA